MKTTTEKKVAKIKNARDKRAHALQNETIRHIEATLFEIGRRCRQSLAASSHQAFMTTYHPDSPVAAASPPEGLAALLGEVEAAVMGHGEQVRGVWGVAEK